MWPGLKRSSTKVQHYSKSSIGGLVVGNRIDYRRWQGRNFENVCFGFRGRTITWSKNGFPNRTELNLKFHWLPQFYRYQRSRSLWFLASSPLPDSICSSHFPVSKLDNMPIDQSNGIDVLTGSVTAWLFALVIEVKHNETLFKLLGGFTERVNTKQNPSSVRKSSRVLGICTGVQLVYGSVLYSTGVLINKKLQTQLVGYQ